MTAARPRSRRRFTRPLAAVTAAYATVLVWATHHPAPQDVLGPNIPPDKTLHFVAYGLLGLLAAATLDAAGSLSRRTAAPALAALLLFAAIDEVTQPLFGRHAELLDWVYDAIGLTGGVAVVAVARRWLEPPTRRSAAPKPGASGAGD